MKLTAISETNYFDTGTFSGDDGIAYSVKAVVNWAKTNKTPQRVNIRRLARELFGPGFAAVESLGSPEWQTRASAANMSYPILVVREPGGTIYAADGNHRLWRAFKSGSRYIMAYVLDQAELTQDAVAGDGTY